MKTNADKTLDTNWSQAMQDLEAAQRLTQASSQFFRNALIFFLLTAASSLLFVLISVA